MHVHLCVSIVGYTEFLKHLFGWFKALAEGLEPTKQMFI